MNYHVHQREIHYSPSVSFHTPLYVGTVREGSSHRRILNILNRVSGHLPYTQDTNGKAHFLTGVLTKLLYNPFALCVSSTRSSGGSCGEVFSTGVIRRSLATTDRRAEEESCGSGIRGREAEVHEVYCSSNMFVVRLYRQHEVNWPGILRESFTR